MIISAEKVVEPLRQELSRDQSFVLSTAKEVNAMLKVDRNATLSSLADSELEISADNVPKLTGDLTSKHVHDLDNVLSPLFGESWFKDRKTFAMAIVTNQSLMSSICTVFYLQCVPMLELVRTELNKSFPDSSRTGVIVDGVVMEEFFNSADLVRTEAWKNVAPLYNKARERLQRNIRAKRHRRKVKSEKLFPEEGSDHEDKKLSGSSDSESEGSGSKKSSSSKDDFIRFQESRLKKKLPPLKSVQECVEGVMDLVTFLKSKAKSKEKYDRVTALFEEHIGKLEPRVGMTCEGEELKICMGLATMILANEILPESLSLESRLQIVTKEFFVQGMFIEKPPGGLASEIRVSFESVMEKQFGILGELVNRWVPDVTDSQTSLTKAESKSVQAMSAEIGAIVEKCEQILQNGEMIRAEVSWILTSICRFNIRHCALLSATPKSSSLIRTGQLVSEVAGLFFVFLSYYRLIIVSRMAHKSIFEDIEAHPFKGPCRRSCDARSSVYTLPISKWTAWRKSTEVVQVWMWQELSSRVCWQSWT